MTLCIVVACKDGFYLISDTRTHDEEAKCFTDNTKKSFHSEKHKLGICVSEDAFLTNPLHPNDLEKSISISFIMDHYFQELEEKSEDQIKERIKSIGDIFELLQRFIQKKYGDEYLLVFQSNVSVFIACIINSTVFVGSYHGKKGDKKWSEFNFSSDFKDKVCFFSNYQDLFFRYAQIAVEQIEKFEKISGDTDCEKINKFMSEKNQNYRECVLGTVLNNTMFHVLAQHEASIGDYFFYIKLKKI